MRKNSKINYDIMTWPQEKARYEELAVKIAGMEKNFDKQLDKIFEVLYKLVKMKNKNKQDR